MLLISSSIASADGPVYGELMLGVGGVTNTDLEFYPALGSVSVGAYVYENIGVELFADSGLRSGEDADFTLDVDQAYGVALRLQSPPVDGVQGFIVLGAVSYTLEQQLSSGVAGSAAGVSDEFVGVRASIGLMQRLVRFPALQLTAEYRHYNADEPIRLDAVLLGLRFNAP